MNLSWLSSAVKPTYVSVPISPDDPLIVLKNALDWPAIRAVLADAMRAAGRNVDGALRSRRVDIDFWLPVIVLGIVLCKNSRELELLLADSARARVFVGFENSPELQLRDYSSIARMNIALATSGAYEKINKLVIEQAQKLGFTDAELLSGDTTAQQAAIAHPNEPNILSMGGKSVLRIVSQLKATGRTKLGDLAQTAKRLVRKGKEYFLFAKGPEQKAEVLQRMLALAEQMKTHGKTVQARLARATGQKIEGLKNRLEHITSCLEVLLPQIHYWLKTGTVAKEKVLHIGMNMVRSMLRHKPGKKCEFGLRQLVLMLNGGYLLSEEVSARAAEVHMVDECLAAYRKQFGEGAVPNQFVYDRGAWSKENIGKLKAAGVKKVGIQPKGKARWRVQGEDRLEVMRLRSRQEGYIGDLKNDRGMDRAKERRHDTFRAVTPRAVLSANLNKTMINLMAMAS